MKLIVFKYFLPIVLFFACADKKDKKKQGNGASSTLKTIPGKGEKIDSLTLAGNEIQGDFNGDGKFEEVSATIVSDAIFQEKAYGFKLFFSDQSLPSFFGETISTSDTAIYLINEGNLNNIPGDEITLYMPPLNGFTYTMDTYTLVNGKWKEFMEPVLVPTAFYEGQEIDLQKIIFLEDGVVYYNITEPGSSEFKSVKKRATLKNP